MSKTLQRELREKYPALGKRADSGTSLTSAVKLFCLGCVGGREDVKTCSNQECDLWPYRPYADEADRVRTKAYYPTPEEYDAMVTAKVGDDPGGALRAYRERQAEAEDECAL